MIGCYAERVPEIGVVFCSGRDERRYWIVALQYAEDAERATAEESLVPALGAYIALVRSGARGRSARRTLDDRR